MYYHLTQKQRIELSLLRRLGYSMRQAAVQLGVNPSTVCRELRCNARANGIYHATSARMMARERRMKANALRHKLTRFTELADLVEGRLKRHDSPEQIAGWLKETGAKLRVSAQTIYDWIYLHAEYLKQHLHCRKGKYRRTRAASLRKAFRDKQKEARRITARPASVLKRNRYGHWEGDTVVGKGHSGAIATFVERRSGYLLAALLKHNNATEFETAAKRCFAAIPPQYQETLTLDNGSEMARFERIEQATRLRIYFAHPYHAWERGTNENTNGLLRFYFPKSTDLAQVSQTALDSAVKELNTRPRKRLGYKTPAEVFERRW